MSNRIFQNVIVQLKDATDRILGVMDPEGIVISCSDTSLLGERWPEAALKVGSSLDAMVSFEGRTFKAIVGNSNYYEYAVFSSGEDEMARSMCLMAYVALNDAKVFYEERHDRGTFVKNIIMDNILPGDIYIRAKELHFSIDAPRAVFLVRQLGHGDVAAVEVLQSIFSDRLQDFVLSINESDIVIVKALPSAECPEVIASTAALIEKTLLDELGIKCVIGISTNAHHLRELAVRKRKDHHQLREPRPRPHHLSAPDYSVRDVPQRSLQEESDRDAGRGHAGDYQQVLRE